MARVVQPYLLLLLVLITSRSCFILSWALKVLAPCGPDPLLPSLSPLLRRSVLLLETAELCPSLGLVDRCQPFPQHL